MTVTALAKSDTSTYEYGLDVLKNLCDYLNVSSQEMHDKYLRNIIRQTYCYGEQLTWHSNQTESLIFDMILRNTNFLMLSSYYDDIVTILDLVMKKNSPLNPSIQLSVLMILSETFQNSQENLNFCIDSDHFDVFVNKFIHGKCLSYF